jgi:hypothetical protein
MGALAASAEADPVIRVFSIHTGTVRDIEAGESVFLFGVRPNEEVEFEFVVENVGDGFLSPGRVEAEFNPQFPNRSFGHSSNPDGFVGRVGFRPVEIGPFDIQVSVTTNLPDSPFTFELEGTVRAPILTLSNDGLFISPDQPLEMAPVEVGESVAAIIDAKNSGNSRMEFVGEPEVAELTGNGDASEMTMTLPETVDAQTIADIVVNFRPQSVGEREFLVTIPTNDPDSPHEFVIQAEALPSFPDCNLNDIDDLEEIATQTSTDCDGNGEPDECQGDADGDDVIDPCDLCPGEDDQSDVDGDDVPDCLDNCPNVANRDQADTDDDGFGDECDFIDADLVGDADGAFEDCNDNGFDDLLDIDEKFAEDCNENDVPDECEPDDDGDEVIDECDLCPDEDDTIDDDDDGVPSCTDNCPDIANASQRDTDGNGIGDDCEFDLDANGDAGNPAAGEDDDNVAQGNPDNADLENAAEENAAVVANNFCGAGVAALLPFTMFGLIGLRPRPTRSRLPR